MATTKIPPAAPSKSDPEHNENEGPPQLGVGLSLDQATTPDSDNEKALPTEYHAVGEAGIPGPGAPVEDAEKRPNSRQEHAVGVDSGYETERTELSSRDGGSSNIIGWNGDDDPEHPYNWPAWQTRVNCGLINVANFIAPLGSTIFAPAVPQVVQEFNNHSPELAAFVVSVDVLGFAFGPLLMAPLSEMYGRVKIYHVCNVGFIAFTIACAVAPDMNSLIVFRLLSGIFGSAYGTTGGGSITDMVPQDKRAGAMAVCAAGSLLGPIVGPILGGFITAAWGWRWTQWVVAIASGALSIVFLFTFRESYHPVILERKVARLRAETGNLSLRSKHDLGLSPSDLFKRSIIRPLKLLSRSPIVALSALFIGISYAILFLMFTSMTSVFQEHYNFGTSTVGLAFVGLGVGSVLGVVVYASTSDRYLRKKAAELDALSESDATTETDPAATGPGTRGRGVQPEHRLLHLPIGSLMLPTGLLVYGWTIQYKVHWVVPIMATSLIAAGNILVYMSLQMFLVDTFTIYAASALAAMTVVRSVAAALLPLSGVKLYASLGVGWGNSLLAFINLLFIPVAFLIKKFGAYLRNRYEIKTL